MALAGCVDGSSAAADGGAGAAAVRLHVAGAGREGAARAAQHDSGGVRAGSQVPARPQVSGHRGAGGMLGAIAPEDTLAAYRAGIATGLEFVETDPRPTADGVLVNIHDPEVNRTTDGKGYVESMTLAEPAGAARQKRRAGRGLFVRAGSDAERGTGDVSRARDRFSSMPTRPRASICWFRRSGMRMRWTGRSLIRAASKKSTRRSSSNRSCASRSGRAAWQRLGRSWITSGRTCQSSSSTRTGCGGLSSCMLAVLALFPMCF